MEAEEVGARVRYDDGSELDVPLEELVPIGIEARRIVAAATPATTPADAGRGAQDTPGAAHPPTGGFQCPDCPKSFPKAMSLGRHRRFSHGYVSPKTAAQRANKAAAAKAPPKMEQEDSADAGYWKGKYEGVVEGVRLVTGALDNRNGSPEEGGR